MRTFFAFVVGCAVLVTCLLACLFFARMEVREYEQSCVEAAYKEASERALVERTRQDVADGYITEKEFHEMFPKEQLYPTKR